MKRQWIVSILMGVAALCLFSTAALAGSYRLQYKMAPGQVWIATISTQSESTMMGQKNVNQSKSIIEYRISKGPKEGWINLSARIKSQGASKESGGMDLSKLLFTAEMHQSGELRNIRYSGSVLPPMDKDTGEMPAGMEAMYEQSSKMIAEAWENAVFWLPELPEEPLQPGDEFEANHKMGMGNESMGMQMQSVSKQIFILDEVSEGLAYFSVKERTVTKSDAPMGGKSDTKTAGKGDAVFDLREGIWTDLTMKSRSKVEFGNMPGMGKASQELNQISKYRMEKR